MNDWQGRREEERRVGDGGRKIREEGAAPALATATATVMGVEKWYEIKRKTEGGGKGSSKSLYTANERFRRGGKAVGRRVGQ